MAQLMRSNLNSLPCQDMDHGHRVGAAEQIWKEVMEIPEYDMPEVFS